ncbi:MAG: hypothetical protein LQ349_005631, partial [Xanthoria aureola]
FIDTFLQHHASANRKSFASWYNSKYPPANKKHMSRQANVEMEKMLKHCTGQHELTRSQLGPETLAIVSQACSTAKRLATLNIAPAELNEARIWLYESTQGEIVEHYPYRLPFYYKELDTDGQTTLPPWPYPQYAEPEPGKTTVSDLKRLSRTAFRHLTGRDRPSYQANHSSRHHPYARPGAVERTTTHRDSRRGAGSSGGGDQHVNPTGGITADDNDADGITEAPPADQTAITEAPPAIQTAITEPQTQQENGVAEERAVEGATHAVPDPNGSSSGSHHGLRDSHVDTHGTAEHAHAPPAVSAAFAEVRNKPEESDEETSDSDGGF